MLRIDLNCDLGEGITGNDKAVARLVSSANIACGFHAGDFRQMHDTIALCLRHGAAVGAHPGYPDRAGFGRQAMDMNFDDLKNMVIYQVGALASLARSLGTDIAHVKPHGALYNLAAVDEATAKAVIEAVLSLEGPALFALAGSPMAEMARSAGLTVYAEGFADRAYNSDGTLVSRMLPGAVITDPAAAAGQALQIVRDGKVTAIDGLAVSLKADTLCVHGDNPNAALVLSEIRTELAAHGVIITAPHKQL